MGEAAGDWLRPREGEKRPGRPRPAVEPAALNGESNDPHAARAGYLGRSRMLVGLPLAGLIRRVKVYDVFIDGAKEGFGVAIKIIPSSSRFSSPSACSAPREPWSS